MSTSGLRPVTNLGFSPKGTTSTRSLPRCTARRVVQGCRGSTHHAGALNPSARGAGGLAAGCGGGARGGGAAAGAGGAAGWSLRLPPNICDGSQPRFSSIWFRRSGEPVLQLLPARDMSRPKDAWAAARTTLFVFWVFSHFFVYYAYFSFFRSDVYASWLRGARRRRDRAWPAAGESPPQFY